MNPLSPLTVLALSSILMCSVSVAEAQPVGDKRLLQKASVQATAQPVEAVLRELCEKHKLPVEFDASVKDEAWGEIPFTFTADGLTLGSAIHLVCRSANLVGHIEKGKLKVMSSNADSENPITIEYPLNPLGPIPDVQTFAADLMSVSPGIWAEIHGEGGEIVGLNPRSITISQSRTVHAEMQALLEQIAAASSGRARQPTVAERAEQTIARKLQSPSQLPADSMSVTEALGQLLKKTGVPYWVDDQALKEEGIDWSMLTVTPDSKKATIAARLDAMLGEFKLVWTVADEVIQITTKVKSDESPITRVYDVRRHITPNQSLSSMALQLKNNSQLGPWETDDDDGGVIMEFRTLLIISHPPAIHAKLASLLK